MRRWQVRNNRGAMPLWAKIVLGLVVVGILGVIAIGAGLYFFFKDFMTTDPAAIATMSKDVAVMSEPLPAGFKWTMGMNMKVSKILAATSSDQQMVMLISIPAGTKDPETMLTQASTRPSYGSQARMVSVDAKGTDRVGGMPMAWELGTMEKDGQQSKGFIGFIVDKANNKSIMIVGVQPRGEYNLNETKAFLKGIQKI